MKKTVIVVFLVSMFLCFLDKALAEPSTGWVHITNIRPYSAADHKIYLNIDSNALCNTSCFVIKSDNPNGKEMYAAALASVIAGKAVMLEISNTTGCTGWGTLLQSLYVSQ